MTAVASPPSLPSFQRLSWNLGDGNQGGSDPVAFSGVTPVSYSSKRREPLSSTATATARGSPPRSSSLASGDGDGDVAKAHNQREGWIPKKARALWSTARDDSDLTTFKPPPGPSLSASTSSAVPLASPNMTQLQQSSNGRATPQAGTDPPTLLVLTPLNGTFERKQIVVPMSPEKLRIGRQTNAKTIPTTSNGYFDSKVLSRQHAEIWADRGGKVWIRDVKSSNGTFVNSNRLSPENRESEPHELREGDTLELGIDIVSEDQKSIVHHKVSTKVEHAGQHITTNNVLDLNFGDIDPASGGGTIGPPFPSQIRGRGSQASSSASNRTHNSQITNGHVNGFGPPRPMNPWLSPITIEQVVKRLTTELKQAKQQSHDVTTTQEFFSSLLSQEEHDVAPYLEQPAVSDAVPATEPHTNGVYTSPIHPASPFSHPPAPPPQQPLPEKPDNARSSTSESSPPSIRKIESERARSLISPLKPDFSSSQILSLVEALTSAKREIDSQGVRVMHLEDLLRQERKAREDAEERARNLMRTRSIQTEATVPPDEAFEPLSSADTMTWIKAQNTGANGNSVDDPSSKGSPESHSAHLSSTTSQSGLLDRTAEELDVSTAHLQARLDSMIREMDELKQELDSHKRKAEVAEEQRSGLAAMIQRIRNGDLDSPPPKSTSQVRLRHKSTEMATQTDCGPAAGANESTLSHATPESSNLNAGANLASKPSQELQDLQQAIMSAMGQQTHFKDDRLRQSAPYASMLGVVLIGVGLMTYLNGWQKVER